MAQQFFPQIDSKFQVTVSGTPVLVSCAFCNVSIMEQNKLVFAKFQQECIPVGCVPSAAVAVRGRCLPRGVSARGVSTQGVVSAQGEGVRLGVSVRGCLLGGGVVSAQGVVYPGGVSAKQTGVKTLPCRNYGAGGNKIPLELGLCKPIFKTFFSASNRFPKCLEFFVLHRRQ